MDAASIIGVVAAAAQFADTARKLAKLMKEVHAGTEAEPTKRRLVQLETWAEVADKIRESGMQDDPQTEKILKQCIPTVEALADQFGRVQISEADGRRERTRKAIQARWEKDDVAELFAQLRRDQMTLLTYRSFSSEGHFLQKIRDTMGTMLDERLQYSRTDGQAASEAEFLNTIFVTDPRDDRSALVNRKKPRAKGTCTWITQMKEYSDWMSTAALSPGLIVEGGPGKGKSMIAIFLTEHLEQLTQTSEAGTESVIYFFCDNRNPKQNNALAVIRCLVWQLCRLRPHLLHHGIKELKARGRGHHLLEPPAAAVETLWRIFLNMLRDERAGTVSCVIDGLDECDEDSISSVLTKFYGFAVGEGASRSKFKFIILSRPLSPRCYTPPRGGSPIPKICLDPDLNEKDISVFIEQRTNELAESNLKKPWRNSLRRKVKETLLKKAGGTFLWVGFVADDLQGKTAFEATRCLRTLPIGLHAMASSLMLDAVSDTDASRNSDLDVLDDLLQYCKQIIKITDDEEVHFVHQSAKDYLMRTSNNTNLDLDYFLVGDSQVRHEQLGLRCMEILENSGNLMDLDSASSAEDDGLDAGLNDHGSPSLDYAAVFWVHHLKFGVKEYHDPTTSHKVLQFIEKGGSLRRLWLDRYKNHLNEQPLGHRVDLDLYKDLDGISSLTLAMAVGLGTTVRQLILPMSVDDYVSAMQSASVESFLGLAILQRQTHIVNIILERFGSDVVSRDPGSLSTAVFKFDEQALRLLLSLKPSPREVHGKDLDKALAYAVRLNDPEIVAELINAGADIHASTEDGRSLLSEFACDRASFLQELGVELAEWLLAKGLDPAQNDTEYGQTPLHIAVGFSDFSLASLLLEWKAPINAVDFAGRTPLHEAASSGDFDDSDKDMIALLIGAGAGWNIRATGGSDSALSIEYWIIDRQDSKGHSALHLAAQRAWTGAVELLLGSGADPNVKDKEGRTPLILLIDALLDNGWYGQLWRWERDWQDHMQRSTSCMHLLKTGKANGNEQDKTGRTALHSLAQMTVPIPAGIPCRRYCLGLEVLEALSKLGIDEGLRDASGKIAREYYPVDCFWQNIADGERAQLRRLC
ncbi:hypothetical protein ACHAQH_005331 [Verticillium albo-atrum]